MGQGQTPHPEGRSLKTLLVLNPNTTTAMTHKVVEAVALLAGEGLAVQGATASFGHPVIASRPAYETGAEAALAVLRGHAGPADAVLLACFGDPGLERLRAESAVPVVGVAEAALLEAQALGTPCRVVTAGSAWPALLREGAARWGLAGWLEGVAVLETDGLAISRDPEAFRAAVQAALDRAAADGVRTVVLGGMGFVGMRSGLRFRGTLIDGLEAGVRAALLKLGSDTDFRGFPV